MKVTQQVIADTAGITLSKVKADSSRGKLDMDDFGQVVCYTMANMMLRGVERVSNLIPAEAIIPAPTCIPVLDLEKKSAPQAEPSDFEERVVREMMGMGHSRDKAGLAVVSMRKRCGVDRLTEANADELGI